MVPLLLTTVSLVYSKSLLLGDTFLLVCGTPMKSLASLGAIVHRFTARAHENVFKDIHALLALRCPPKMTLLGQDDVTFCDCDIFGVTRSFRHQSLNHHLPQQ